MGILSGTTGYVIGFALMCLFNAVMLCAAVDWVLKRKIAFSRALITSLMLTIASVLGSTLQLHQLQISPANYLSTGLTIVALVLLVQGGIIAWRERTGYFRALLVALTLLIISTVVFLIILFIIADLAGG